jgi:hypothetical protein
MTGSVHQLLVRTGIVRIANYDNKENLVILLFGGLRCADGKESGQTRSRTRVVKWLYELT